MQQATPTQEPLQQHVAFIWNEVACFTTCVIVLLNDLLNGVCC